MLKCLYCEHLARDLCTLANKKSAVSFIITDTADSTLVRYTREQDARTKNIELLISVLHIVGICCN